MSIVASAVPTLAWALSGLDLGTERTEHQCAVAIGKDFAADHPAHYLCIGLHCCPMYRLEPLLVFDH